MYSTRRPMEKVMQFRFLLPIALLSLGFNDPAFASKWLAICSTASHVDAIQIKTAKTGEQLPPLKSGDLVYTIYSDKGSARSPTLAFRRGKLTEIAPSMEQLEEKHLVDCAGDEPKTPEYPIIVDHDNASEAQLIYDEFGFTTDFFFAAKGETRRANSLLEG
jgi:hypothetical protein